MMIFMFLNTIDPNLKEHFLIITFQSLKQTIFFKQNFERLFFLQFIQLKYSQSIIKLTWLFNYILNFKEELKFCIKMDEFQDFPAQSGSKTLTRLFSSSSTQFFSKTARDKFVPYEKERDQLGRLLSSSMSKHKSNNFPQQLKKYQQSVPFASQKQKQEQQTDQMIDRLFKTTLLRSQSSKNERKKKILSTAVMKHPQPAIGYYDSAEINDRFKYRKSQECNFGAQKASNSKTKHSHFQKQPRRKMKTFVYSQLSTQQPSRANQEGKAKKLKESLDFNLPQLQKYLQSKKLKMNLNEDFQGDHMKFKDLVRKSLILAQKIKNSLQLD